jgi:uncharacterized protein (DUF58 family)
LSIESALSSIGEKVAPLTPRGRGVLFVAVLLLVSGLIAGTVEGYALASLATALFALVIVERFFFVARVASASSLNVRWSFSPDPPVEGRPLQVRVVVENQTFSPVEYAVFIDDPPPLFRVKSPPSAPLFLLAKSSAVVEYTVEPVLGRHKWGKPRIIVEDPLGFFRWETVLPVETPTLTVYPQLLALPRRRLGLPTVLQPGGITKMRRRGIGAEFMELREYSVDDDSRLIDWKATARLGRLMVKVFEQESYMRVVLIVDETPTMFRGVIGETKIEYSVRLASTLAEYFSKRYDYFRVIIVGPNGELSMSPWLRGRVGANYARRLLAEKTVWPRVHIGSKAESVNAFFKAVDTVAVSGKNMLLIVISDFHESPTTAREYAIKLHELVEHNNTVYAIMPVTALFEVRALKDKITANIYKLLVYESITKYKEIARILRLYGVKTVVAGPQDLLHVLLNRIEAMRGVMV